MDWTLFASSIAAVFAVIGVGINLQQLRVAREASLGRALAVQISRDDDEVPIRVSVAATGPGVWTDMAAFVAGPDGTVVETLWRRNKYTVEDPSIHAVIPPAARPDQDYVVITWYQAAGDSARLMALRIALTADERTELFQWYSAPVRWLAETVLRHRPAGRWRPMRPGIDAGERMPGVPARASRVFDDLERGATDG